MWRPFLNISWFCTRRLVCPYKKGHLYPGSFPVCQCVPIHALPPSQLPWTLLFVGGGHSESVLVPRGSRPWGTLTARWKGNGCWHQLPTSHPCPCQSILLKDTEPGPFPGSPGVPHTVFIFERWKGQPGRAERSHWEVLIRERLWSGSFDMVMLGGL